MRSVEELLEPGRRAALAAPPVHAARCAVRIAALRKKVRAMSCEELNALSQALRRRGEDLKEEYLVISEILHARNQDSGRRFFS